MEIGCIVNIYVRFFVIMLPYFYENFLITHNTWIRMFGGNIIKESHKLVYEFPEVYSKSIIYNVYGL